MLSNGIGTYKNYDVNNRCICALFKRGQYKTISEYILGSVMFRFTSFKLDILLAKH